LLTDQYPWLAFLGAALLALIVALLTVSIQAIKAALTNPVNLYEQSESPNPDSYGDPKAETWETRSGSSYFDNILTAELS
jgi:hypothetical protein